jgi:uncharacterized LabA/DUF88 family protein
MLTNFYIDGFNLYLGCLKDTSYKWLNLVEFCRRSFPPPKNQLHRVRYFTAPLKPYPSDPSQPIRQATYLRALETLPEVSIHYGHFKKSRPWAKLVTPLSDGTTTVQIERSQEKGSDVNLATHLLLDAFQNDYDAAVVVTNDPDQREPIHAVGKQLGKNVLVLFPIRPGRFGNTDLKKAADRTEVVNLALLAACQLPPIVTTAKGRQIRKPASW